MLEDIFMHTAIAPFMTNGKAVSRSTYQHHRKAAQESQILNSSDLQVTTNDSEGAPGSSECNSDPGKFIYPRWKNFRLCELSKKFTQLK